MTINRDELIECILNRICLNEEDYQEQVQVMNTCLTQDGSRLLFLQQMISHRKTLDQCNKLMRHLENIQGVINSSLDPLVFCDHRTALRLLDRKIISLNGETKNYW